MPKRMHWGKIVPLFLLLTVLVLTACGGQPEGAGEQETVTAAIGDVSSAATASGQIDSLARAELAVTLQGLVTNINVRVGDEVETGDVLIEFDTRELDFAVRSAQQNLINQQAALADLQEPASAADIASAEAALASAQARLEKLETGADEFDIAVAEANLRSAQASISSAQANLNATFDTVSEASIEAAKAELVIAQNQFEQLERTLEDVGDFANKRLADAYESAKVNFLAAQAKYDRILAGADPNAVGAQQQAVSAASARASASEADLIALQTAASTADMAAAQANVASAEARLAALMENAKSEDIAIAEANVKSAEISLEDAQYNLDNAIVSAPFDGVITAIHVAPGEVANGIVLEMADHKNLEIVLQVDEIDIASITLGQEAVVTLETWPDEEISSQVKSIAPSAGSSNSGITSYDVHLELAEADIPILIGMTANANLLTAKRDGVLLVPNRAITSDRSSGRYFVDVQTTDADGVVSAERVEIKIGLRDSQNTQILDGINEGDILAVNYSAPVIVPGQGGGPPDPGR